MSRRRWFALDVNFTSDPKIARLATHYGAAGPLVVIEVLALAKLADAGGVVREPYAEVARRAFVRTPRRAREIVLAACEEEVFDLEREDGREFIVTIPRWTRWQVKDPTNADRQAALRARRGAVKSNGESNGGDRYERERTRDKSSPRGVNGGADGARATNRGRSGASAAKASVSNASHGGTA